MPAVPSLPPRTASVSELLDAASRIWRATLPKCLPLAMIAILSAYLPALYLSFAGLPIPKPPQLPQDPLYWVCYVLALITYLFVGSIAIVRQRDRARTGRCDFDSAWRTAARRLPALLLTILLCQLAVGVGLMLLVLPGIYVFVCSFVVWCIVLFEPVNPWTAMVSCIRRVHPQWWKHCATIVIALVITVVSVFTVLILVSLLLGALLSTGSAAGNAIAVAIGIAAMGAALLFITSVAIVLYSVASSSD
jgi:hypothetical protein